VRIYREAPDLDLDRRMRRVLMLVHARQSSGS
jgi:hypothetical protein